MGYIKKSVSDYTIISDNEFESFKNTVIKYNIPGSWSVIDYITNDYPFVGIIDNELFRRRNFPMDTWINELPWRVFLKKHFNIKSRSWW